MRIHENLTEKLRSDRYLPLLWLLLAWPLTLLGFGSDPDAWRLARAAEQIWATKHYVVSRTIGFPLFELLEAPLVHFGSWYLANLLPLAAGLACLIALVRLGRRGWIRHRAWTPILFVFHPLVLTASSSAMDYMPALALLLWAYLFLLDGRWLWSSALVGVAVGFRVTSGIFIVPLCVYALAKGQPVRRVSGMLATTLLTGLVAYAPALLEQGIRSPYAQIAHGLRGHLLAAGYNALAALGILQTPVLMGLLVRWGIRAKFRFSRIADPVTWLHVVNVATGLLLFLFAPYEPAYLLPAIWSATLLADRHLDARRCAILALVALSYHVVGMDVVGGESGRREIRPSVQAGATIRDVEDRIFKLSTRRAATEYAAERPTVLMFGEPWIPTTNAAWAPDLHHRMYRQVDGNLYVSERILDPERMHRLTAEGFRIVLWQGEKWEYFSAGKTDLLAQVEMIASLDRFFGRDLAGRPLNQR